MLPIAPAAARLPARRPTTRLARHVTPAFALCLLAGAARADLPMILDRAPANTVAAIVTPSLGQLDKNLGAISDAVGSKISASTLLAGIGLGAGVAMDKPAAALMLPGDMNADVPPIVLLMPIADFKGFAAAHAGKDEGGISHITLAGDDFFGKPLDGAYAALSPVKDLIAKNDFAPAQLGAHAAALGKAGGEVANKADVFLMFNGEQVRALSAKGQNPLGPMMKAAMSKVGLPLGMGDMMSGPMFKDATAGVLGLRPSAAGVHVDFAVNYKAGSEMANGLQTGGDSSALLKALPQDPFLLAFGVDLSPPGVKTILKNFEVGDNGEGGLGDPSLAALIDQARGQSGVIYPNPAGFFGGVLARGVYFYAGAEPAKLGESFKSKIEAMNNQMMGSAQASTDYKAGADTIDGVSTDTWNVKMTTQGQGSPLAMFYGPSGGPNGYAFKAKNGFYTTTVADKKLVSKAISASKGESPLGADAGITTIAGMLPANRTAEAYVGVKAILEQAAPWLKMMGKPVDFKPPETLAPAGMGLVVDSGGFRIDGYVTGETIKAVRSFVTAIQTPAAPAGAGGAPAEQPKKPSF